MATGGTSMADRADHLTFDAVGRASAREYPDMPLAGFLMGAVLMRMGRIVEKDFSELCSSRFGVIGPEMMLLLALRRVGAPYAARPAHLKRVLLLTSGAVTKQIDRLSGKGLVERQPDPGSRNGQLIRLTPTGHEMTTAVASMLAKDSVAVHAFESLGAELAEHGLRFCQQMIDRLESTEVGDEGTA